MYDIHMLSIAHSSQDGFFLTNGRNDQLSVSLVIEHCSGIAEVMGSNYVKPEFFASFIFTAA